MGIRLPSTVWAEDEGLAVQSVTPLIEIVGRDDFVWHWPAAFVAVNAHRLHALGYVEADEADRLATLLERAPRGTRLITPLVSEVIVRKPGG